MIECTLSTLLGARRMSIAALARESGIRYASLHALYTNKATRYDAKTLAGICATLGVGVGELLVYVPGRS